MDTRLVSGLFTLVLVVVALGLIWLGWRNRLKRQSDVAALPALPEDPGTAMASSEGQYVSSTTAGDWLDRIAVHSLGIRTNATLSVHPDGVLYLRSGAPDIFIPASQLTGVRKDSGMTGKFVEKDGLVIVSWILGTHELDTGFRSRSSTDRDSIFDALQELIAAASADPASGK
ncbi:hypothetical protein [Pseudarthrobacter sp. PS3-L1]|uniref:PH-like domain-containing protein n=1 Tax=Pseudarthrobacter sp. PS3-L1 TaxID=3046207 RepID=UPI0024BA4421|nr:hypothetical protein [Pseudarthrobacter sp. PS3-L1]MDJ0320067.1 hypothetical protein [Pseudarthrobacter sp. PS3-L1]